MSEQATTREGFAVLWVGVKREPWVFTVATVGAVLFGVLTIADAWVLGWSTDHVLIPAFETGHVDGNLFWAVFGLFLAVAILRALGVVGRRLGGGLMYYRMQSHTRRGVTRQYLSLPMEWHQRHPTGQLLSNAYSDVEAAWSPIMPFPMALGTLVMMVIAVVQMLAADVMMALVGLLVFPLVVVANLAYQKLASPLMTRAQQLRAEVARSPTSPSTARWWSRRWAARVRETARFAEKARELRDVNIRAVRRYRAAPSTRSRRARRTSVSSSYSPSVSSASWAATPTPATWSRSPTCSPSSPSRSARSAGCSASSRARSSATAGRRRCSTRPVRCVRRLRPARPATGARLDVDSLAYAYAADTPLLEDVTFTAEPGRTVALVGSTASGKSTLTNLDDLAGGAAGVSEVDL